MKTLDSQSLHNGIDQLQKKIETQINQLKQLENSIDSFSNLENSFSGTGGKAIRSFYEDWHLPFLSFYYYTLTDYERVLTSIKKASKSLESNSNGFIRQSFLEGELTTGLHKLKSITTGLVDEANGTLEDVSDIVYVPRLNDQPFHSHIQRANRRIEETIEDLNVFDRTETNELDIVAQDLQLMKSYITEIQGMFKSGGLSIENYNADQLKKKPDFQALKSNLAERELMNIGNMFTNPFDYINQQMSFGDMLLAGYQSSMAIATLAFSRKLNVHYFRSKPTLWNKIRGKYEFSVRMDPSWTSKGKHSSKMAKKLLDFSRAPMPSNPVMRSLQKFVKSYNSPSHLFKHVAGFPKNFDKISGKDFMKGNQVRMAAGTKEVVGKAVSNSGFVKIGKRVPIVGTGISAITNAGEIFSPENVGKSRYETVGRALGGFLADMGSIAIGAKVGATIGTVGGPVGIIIGGAIGAFVGGVASSKIGSVAKDFGERVGSELGKVGGKIGTTITDMGGKLKSSISSWFN
ncbi:toxin YxiD [Cytobacillus horneckiae]|uniref:ribonuclease YeeF family protein n=1 Tax=Cytobacillus horneckiae TaxID=549687 RepID=UPI0019D17604|nr:LXG domain-containing protein [Cytobacillus horneckiae]MBN6889704.1 LXG domain-containing protein [Cytobacillus horneckiae]